VPPDPEASGSASVASIVLRALLYAIAISTLVVFAPTESHVFLYQGF
jgi:hypothetical protein